jgi:DNA-binding CsgD family transcriptional regulator
MFDLLARALTELEAASSESGVWRAFGGFMDGVGVPVYVVSTGGDDFVSSHEKILCTNVPTAAIDKLDGAAAGVRPVRRLAWKAARSFLLSEHREELLQGEISRHWFETFTALTGGMDMLVVPVRRDGEPAGIGLTCGAPASFDDAMIAATATLTHAAFAARARIAPAGVRADEGDSDTDGRPRLTPRQACVLDFAAKGLSEEDIAATLGMSRRTVRFHLDEARVRLGVDAKRLAVERARRLGILGG